MNDGSVYKWVVGARPKTLTAAVVPVLVASGIAIDHGAFSWVRALLCLTVSLALQVAVNYANDYSDGVRGTDDVRSGPVRLVGSKLAEPETVKRAAFMAFAVAGLAGFILAALSSWWLLGVGAAAMLAAWLYTGGPNPYGYRGFGELSVFVFFGLVAVVGTAYVQIESFTWSSVLAAVPVGLLAVALLMINNIRDREGDAASGKRTLAVRLGDRQSRRFFTVCTYTPFVVAVLMGVKHPFTLSVLLAVPVAAGAVRMVNKGASGKALVTVLQRTSRLQLVFGVLFAIGLTF